jgi:hypothetical protein
MNRSRTHASLLFALLLVGSIVFAGAGLNASAASASAKSGPIRAIDSSLAEAPGTMMVSGLAFSPGGAVSISEYVAINDQSGLLLYESRSITAGPVYEADGSVDPGGSGPFVRGGDFDASFGSLCGSTVMLHAYDMTTTTWSNWLTLQPNC